MSGLPTNPPPRKPFAEYVGKFGGPEVGVPDGFQRRLCLSVDRINSLAKFQNWARERFPDWYMRRGSGGKGPAGHHIIATLWSVYLAWAEEEES